MLALTNSDDVYVIYILDGLTISNVWQLNEIGLWADNPHVIPSYYGGEEGAIIVWTEWEYDHWVVFARRFEDDGANAGGG